MDLSKVKIVFINWCALTTSDEEGYGYYVLDEDKKEEFKISKDLINCWIKEDDRDNDFRNLIIKKSGEHYAIKLEHEDGSLNHYTGKLFESNFTSTKELGKTKPQEKEYVLISKSDNEFFYVHLVENTTKK